MRLNAPPISEFRLQRYHRWTLLWLRWFAAFLAQAGAHAPLSRQAIVVAHEWLDVIERRLVHLIVIRAARSVRSVPAPRYSGRRRTEAQMVRAIIGSAMRRALRPRDLHDRIAALSQSVEALALRVSRRLPRGLTRRRPVRTRPETGTIVLRAASCIAIPAADTS